MYTTEDKKIKDLSKFIRENPECSMQDIVDKFSNDKKYSRVTIFKTLKRMDKLGRVEIKPKAENRQTKSISLTDGLINRLEEELDLLHKALLELIRELTHSHAEIEFGEIYDMYNILISILSDIVMDYLACAIMKWPRETGSKSVLDSAYAILFSRLSSIVSETSRKYPVEEDPAILEEIIIHGITPRHSQSIENILALMDRSKGHAVHEKVVELITAIRKISANEKLDVKSKLLAKIRV